MPTIDGPTELSVVIEQPNLQLVLTPQPAVVVQLSEQLPPVVPISADPDNRLTRGQDLGLFVPECVADPVAYFILAST